MPPEKWLSAGSRLGVQAAPHVMAIVVVPVAVLALAAVGYAGDESSIVLPSLRPEPLWSDPLGVHQLTRNLFGGIQVNDVHEGMQLLLF